MSWLFAVVIVWLAPIILLAKEDLGTAIPMIPMLLGVLILAGASLRLIAFGGRHWHRGSRTWDIYHPPVR